MDVDMDSLRGRRVAGGEYGVPWKTRLADESVRTVLIAGCGGGFDFVHSMLVYPWLRSIGKNVVILSYSFGVVNNLKGEHAPVVYSASAEGPLCKRVNAKTEAWAQYRPEVGYCSFLDELYPEEPAHSMYACYARDWTITSLTGLYQHIIKEHNVDALLIIDGGSDSLMVGNEKDLGDPIEDAVSIGAASNCNVKTKILISVGFGSDRFNGVSDCSSMRAVAELTKMGGFLGCTSVDPIGFDCYRALVKHIYAQQSFRSVLTSLIVSSGKGDYAFVIPEDSGGRVRREGQAFVWPLMSFLFAFNVDVVAARSKIVAWLRPATSVAMNHKALDAGRKQLEILPEENFPLHADMVGF